MSVFLKDPGIGKAAPLAFIGQVVAVATVEVARHGYVPGGADLQVQHAVSLGIVALAFDGGADGELYTVTIRATMTNGDIAERDLSMMVVGRDWMMPNGDAGWLNVHEFIERFGLDETIAATASDAGGTLDRGFLVAKLQDAQAEAEANIAAQYAMPLASVPAILKTAVADLARARLYRRGVPEEVADNAKIQRRLLERISTSSLKLPMPAGTTALAAESDISASGWSGGSAYPDGLAGY